MAVGKWHLKVLVGKWQLQYKGLESGSYSIKRGLEYGGWKVAFGKGRLESGVWKVAFGKWQLERGVESDIVWNETEGDLKDLSNKNYRSCIAGGG